jgi:hypothetical protein
VNLLTTWSVVRAVDHRPFSRGRRGRQTAYGAQGHCYDSPPNSPDSSRCGRAVHGLLDQTVLSGSAASEEPVEAVAAE